MPTLLEISSDLLALADLMDEASPDGELSADAAKILEEWFATATDDRDRKLDNYCALCRSMELRAAARKEEMERLALRVQADTNAAKRLKDRLKMFLEVQGLKKVETARYTLAVQANGGLQPLKVDVPVEKLPPVYQKVKVEADTDALRAGLAGHMPYVLGLCHLEPRGSHLRIR